MQFHVIIVATEKTAIPDQKYRGTPRQLRSDAVNAAKTEVEHLPNPPCRHWRRAMSNVTKPGQTECSKELADRHHSTGTLSHEICFIDRMDQAYQMKLRLRRTVSTNHAVLDENLEVFMHSTQKGQVPFQQHSEDLKTKRKLCASVDGNCLTPKHFRLVWHLQNLSWTDTQFCTMYFSQAKCKKPTM